MHSDKAVRSIVMDYCIVNIAPEVRVKINVYSGPKCMYVRKLEMHIQSTRTYEDSTKALVQL